MQARPILAAVAVLALSAAPLLAHHGWSGYDSKNPLTVAGELVAVDYRNPHVTVDLKATDKTWHVVLAPPFRMQARGLPDGALRVGETVTVVGYAHTKEVDELRAERITVAGNTVELR